MCLSFNQVKYSLISLFRQKDSLITIQTLLLGHAILYLSGKKKIFPQIVSHVPNVVLICLVLRGLLRRCVAMASITYCLKNVCLPLGMRGRVRKTNIDMEKDKGLKNDLGNP